MTESIHRFRLREATVFLLAFGALAMPTAAGAQLTVTEATGDPGDGTMSATARQAMNEGALTLAADDRAKARGNAATASTGSAAAGPAEVEALAPTATRNWEGIFNTGSAPSDSTGAVGTTRYVETINRNVAIYNKTSNTPIHTNTLNAWWGQAASANSFDPQVIWDPSTVRFYYAGDTVVSSSDNRLSFGFSKTASPNNATTDWCHYQINYGSAFPDYPKLGDSSFFVTFGVNTFNTAGSFIGSDILAVGKPPAGTTCPDASTFAFGAKQNLANTFTPVAVNQTDPSGNGYFIGRNLGLPSTLLRLWRVTRNATTGAPVFGATSTNLTVPNYTVPANAPQRSGFTGSTKTLDTLDARPTQAVSATDPSPAGVNNAPGAIWTQHTTSRTASAGVGAEVRWYEIDPSPLSLVQSGKVTSTTTFNFNGAISPNRGRNGSTVVGGNAMVLGYNASSTSLFPRVRMVSKIGTAAQSAAVAVRTSPGNYNGFDCAGADNDCRWGDYSAATPDPIPGTSAGKVWMTNMYASGGTSTAQANWRTRNWAATP
jgi:hypothetical protein